MKASIYSVHQLAVLRGVADGGEPGKYFASWLALDYWTSEAADAGLVAANPGGELTPTAEGLRIYKEVLANLPACRQTLWDSPALRRLLGKNF